MSPYNINNFTKITLKVQEICSQNNLNSNLHENTHFYAPRFQSINLVTTWSEQIKKGRRKRL